MSDKYYCYEANETTKRGKLVETTINSGSGTVSKYEHGAIISNDVTEKTDVFALTFEANTLKTYETYINNLEITSLDEIIPLNDEDILDIVLDIPRTLYISVSGYNFTGATNTNKIKVKIKGTTTKDGDTQQTYTIELTKSGDNFVGGTNQPFTTIHSIQITDVTEASEEAFTSCNITISSGDGVGLGCGNRTINLMLYYYNGVLQDGVSPNNKSVSVDTTNKKLTFSDKSNFTENNAERKLVFFSKSV